MIIINFIGYALAIMFFAIVVYGAFRLMMRGLKDVHKYEQELKHEKELENEKREKEGKENE